MISFIWAQDQNGVIGSNGQLPWRLPNDMQFFKNTTMGHPVISGATTFRSYNRPLPGRTNIVLSSQSDFPDGVMVVNSISALKELITQDPNEEYFVIGGSTLFEQLKDDVDRLYQTQIDAEFVGDTYMPAIDFSNFELIKTIAGVVDDKNLYPHIFKIYERKEK